MFFYWFFHWFWWFFPCFYWFSNLFLLIFPLFLLIFPMFFIDFSNVFIDFTNVFLHFSTVFLHVSNVFMWFLHCFYGYFQCFCWFFMDFPMFFFDVSNVFIDCSIDFDDFSHVFIDFPICFIDFSTVFIDFSIDFVDFSDVFIDFTNVFLCFSTVFLHVSNVFMWFLHCFYGYFQCFCWFFMDFPMFFFDFSNVFPLFLWLVPMTPSDGPGGNRYPPSPNCNTVHNPAKPPSRNTLSPRGERDLRTTVQLCPPDPLFSLRSHKATSQPAGLPFVMKFCNHPRRRNRSPRRCHLFLVPKPSANRRMRASVETSCSSLKCLNFRHQRASIFRICAVNGGPASPRVSSASIVQRGQVHWNAQDLKIFLRRLDGFNSSSSLMYEMQTSSPSVMDLRAMKRISLSALVRMAAFGLQLWFAQATCSKRAAESWMRPEQQTSRMERSWSSCFWNASSSILTPGGRFVGQYNLRIFCCTARGNMSKADIAFCAVSKAPVDPRSQTSNGFSLSITSPALTLLVAWSFLGPRLVPCLASPPIPSIPSISSLISSLTTFSLCADRPTMDRMDPAIVRAEQIRLVWLRPLRLRPHSVHFHRLADLHGDLVSHGRGSATASIAYQSQKHVHIWAVLHSFAFFSDFPKHVRRNILLRALLLHLIICNRQIQVIEQARRRLKDVQTVDVTWCGQTMSEHLHWSKRGTPRVKARRFHPCRGSQWNLNRLPTSSNSVRFETVREPNRNQSKTIKVDLDTFGLIWSDMSRLRWPIPTLKELFDQFRCIWEVLCTRCSISCSTSLRATEKCCATAAVLCYSCYQLLSAAISCYQLSTLEQNQRCVWFWTNHPLTVHLYLQCWQNNARDFRSAKCCLVLASGHAERATKLGGIPQDRYRTRTLHGTYWHMTFTWHAHGIHIIAESSNFHADSSPTCSCIFLC